MRPIIGILAEVDAERAARVQNTYVKVIEDMGGLPILLPYVEKEESFGCFAALCDGFFFSGGADLHPSRYGEEIKPMCAEIQEHRDELEFRTFEKIIGTKKPILAICRGAQLINAALGGTLYQDIPTQVPTYSIQHSQDAPGSVGTHSITIDKNSVLYKQLGVEKIAVNSFHHQAVKDVAPGFKVTAKSKDGIVEAIEKIDNPKVWGVQFHPEFKSRPNNAHPLFKGFIKAAIDKKENNG